MSADISEEYKKLVELVDSLKSVLECPLCLNIFEKPVTTTCGHSFCTKCLDKSLEFQNGCPLCRKPTVQKGYGKRSTSVALEKALSLLSPKPALTQQQIQQQQEHEAAERKKRWKGTIGIFVLNGFLAIPEQKFFLNVFEPRYLLLVNRSIDNDVPFAVQSGSTKSHGILVKVSKVISQRPFVIECTVVDRYVATSEMKIEPDSAGLFIRDVEVIRDDPINEEEMKVCTTLASQIFNEAISKVDANQRKYLEAVIGPIPVTCTQDLTNELFLCNFSFWLIASLAWVNNQDRDLALASTSLMYRFQKINDNLSNSIHKLGARFNVQQ